MSSISSLLSANSMAADAATRETVSMVPSAGFITALYAESTPFLSAAAKLLLSANSKSRSPFEIPLNMSESMTPELPLAPLKTAEATVSAQSLTDSKFLSLSATQAAVIVRPMLVPVSPSGTGKTLRSFITSLFCSSLSLELSIIFLNSSALICFIKATSSGYILDSVYNHIVEIELYAFYIESR